MRLTQADYYSYPSICYAQGWSLIYFLREAVPKNPKWNEKWGKILDTYFDTLKREANKDKPLTPKKPVTRKPGAAPEPEDPGMGDDDPEPGMDAPGKSGPVSGPGKGEPPTGEPSVTATGGTKPEPDSG